MTLQVLGNCQNNYIACSRYKGKIERILILIFFFLKKMINNFRQIKLLKAINENAQREYII